MILTITTVVGLAIAATGVVILLRMIHKSGLRGWLTPSETAALATRALGPIEEFLRGVTTMNEARQEAALDDVAWKIRQQRMP